MNRKINYDPAQDYYKILGVKPNAAAEIIQQSYRKRAKKYHPDLNQDRIEWAKAQFQRLNEAYSVISDPESRRIYDELRWPFQQHALNNPSTPKSQAPNPPNFWEPAAPMRRRPTPTPQTAYPPVQAVSGAWLQRLGLAWLQPTYAAISGLLHSPYRYLLIILAIASIINIGLILGGFFNPSEDDSNTTFTEAIATPDPISNGERSISNTIPPRTIAPTITLMPAQEAPFYCGDYIEIVSPKPNSMISRADLPLNLIGRIHHPEMFTYVVEAMPLSSDTMPLTLRPAAPNQEAPIESSIPLAPLDELGKQPTGLYSVQITILNTDNSVIETCSISLSRV